LASGFQTRVRIRVTMSGSRLGPKSEHCGISDVLDVTESDCGKYQGKKSRLRLNTHTTQVRDVQDSALSLQSKVRRA